MDPWIVEGKPEPHRSAIEAALVGVGVAPGTIVVSVTDDGVQAAFHEAASPGWLVRGRFTPGQLAEVVLSRVKGGHA